MENEFKEKYINPFTDFGFKKIFGQEYNKDLLLDFLNSILKRDYDPIKDIKYKPTEQYTFTIEDRKSIFDIFCESESGERFIVEMQKSFIIQMLSKGLSEDEIRRLTSISEKDFKEIMFFWVS